MQVDVKKHIKYNSLIDEEKNIDKPFLDENSVFCNTNSNLSLKSNKKLGLSINKSTYYYPDTELHNVDFRLKVNFLANTISMVVFAGAFVFLFAINDQFTRVPLYYLFVGAFLFKNYLEIIFNQFKSKIFQVSAFVIQNQNFPAHKDYDL